MLRNNLLPLVVAFSLLGCASSVPLTLSDVNVKVLTAREVNLQEGPTGITDRFTLEGRIFAFVSFQWKVGVDGGVQDIEAKWYSKGNLISVNKGRYIFKDTPYYIWFWIGPSSFEVGEGRVDIYSRGNVIARHEFMIAPPQ